MAARRRAAANITTPPAKNTRANAPAIVPLLPVFARPEPDTTSTARRTSTGSPAALVPAMTTVCAPASTSLGIVAVKVTVPSAAAVVAPRLPVADPALAVFAGVVETPWVGEGRSVAVAVDVVVTVAVGVAVAVAVGVGVAACTVTVAVAGTLETAPNAVIVVEPAWQSWVNGTAAGNCPEALAVTLTPLATQQPEMPTLSLAAKPSPKKEPLNLQQ